MNNYLNQIRKGITFQVNENPTECSIIVATTDPWATPVPKKFTGRISHDGAGPFFLTNNPSGISSNLSRYLLVDYTVDFLQKNDILNGQWKILTVDPLSKFGGIHGYQCTLVEAV